MGNCVRTGGIDRLPIPPMSPSPESFPRLLRAIQDAPHVEPPEQKAGIFLAEPPEYFRPGNFCDNQCRVLENQLSDAVKTSRKYTLPSNSTATAGPFWPQLALLELRRVVNLGKTLIKGCQNETCLKAYLRQGARTLAFSEMLKEITWCMSVVFYYNNTVLSPGNPSAAMDEFPLARLGAYKELYALQKAAKADRVELLKSLDTWIESHVCGTDECGGLEHLAEDPPLCMAIQIAKRRIDEEENGGIAGIQDSSAVDHASVLWNINSKILKNGTLIGKGGYCSVFETTWLGDTYARKNYEMEDPAVFRNEANALSKLSHPHMVTVSAYSMGSQMCSFLMERMTFDLRHYMRKRQEEFGINPPFSILAAVDLMLQGAEAMMYVHSQGMVHRDLKASNILVKPVDDPELSKHGFAIAKLADFGLAKDKRDITAYSHMTKHQGTKAYMAPEVFEADADNAERLMFAYPKKADVYSFGIVCSEILTGKSPCYRRPKMGDLYRLLSDSEKPLRPELPESCPESLASLIRECWHTNPLKRPEFTEICTMLRYLKGLLMLTGDGQLEPWMVTKLRFVMARQASLSVTNPYSLFYTTFDGSSWTTAVPLPHLMASPNGMSLADHNGTLVGIHRAVEQSKFCQSLYWTTYTSSTWTSAQIIESQTSPSRPAVASFRDRLYCLYRGDGDEIWCTSAGSNLDGGWTGAINAGGSFRTCDGPALVCYLGYLVSLIRGMDNVIYWNSFDGSAWSGYEELGGNTTGSPAAAVYENELHVCFRGIDRHNSGLYWCKLSGSKRSPLLKVECNFGVLSGPSLAVFNNRLVCTWLGSGNQLYYTTLDGSSSWSQVRKIPSQFSQGEQGLCSADSKLFCVYGSVP